MTFSTSQNSFDNAGLPPGHGVVEWAEGRQPPLLDGESRKYWARRRRRSFIQNKITGTLCLYQEGVLLHQGKSPI
jgi:hypothetical protein